MSELDDLIAACRAAPDDDAPRLVWADAVGGERGEFVVLQCRLAREDLSPADAGALIKRHDELVLAHGAEWSGFADTKACKRVGFRRGFVEAVELDVTVLPWTKIFERAPLVQSFHLRGIGQSIEYHEANELVGPDTIAWLSQMFIQPELKRLRGLEIDDAHLYESTGDSEWDFSSTSRADLVLELVARSGALGGLRTLAIHDTFTPRGIHELLGSNALAELESLTFRFGEADKSQLVDLIAQVPKLRALDLHAVSLGDVAAALPSTLVELRVFGSWNAEHVEALATSKAAASLERLAVNGANMKAPPSVFDAFPKLRALDLGFASFEPSVISERKSGEHTRNAVARFVACKLPALRELRTFSALTNEDLLAIVERFGAQLACLDILGAEDIRSSNLIPHVAGYVRAGEYRNSDMLAEVGANTREPWLRYGLVHVSR